MNEPQAAGGPPITVVSGADRLSRREQIELVLEAARAKKEPFRVRIPCLLYDYASDNRSYTYLREGTWSLSFPSEVTTPEFIEELLATLGVCIEAIAKDGAEKVRAKIAREEPA